MYAFLLFCRDHNLYCCLVCFEAVEIRIFSLLNSRELFAKKKIVQHKEASANNNLAAAVRSDIRIHALITDSQTTAYSMTYIEKCGSSSIMIVISLVYYTALFRYENDIILHNKHKSPCSEAGMSTQRNISLCDTTEL